MSSSAFSNPLKVLLLAAMIGLVFWTALKLTSNSGPNRNLNRATNAAFSELKESGRDLTVRKKAL